MCSQYLRFVSPVMYTLRRLLPLCRRFHQFEISLSRGVCGTNVCCEKVLLPPLGNVDVPNVSLPEFLSANVAKYSKLIAIECAVTGRKYTHDEMAVKARNLGRALRKYLPIRQRDVIAVIMPNAPEYSIAILGCLNAGLVVTTVNPSYTPEEISRQLVASSAKAIITSSHLHDNVLKAIAHAKMTVPILVVKDKSSDDLPRNTIDFMSMTNQNIDMPDVVTSPDDLALLPYSSGTTGLPKAVEITHRNIVASITETSHSQLNFFVHNPAEYQDVMAEMLPMFHMYGLATSLSAIPLGNKVVTLPKFTPDLYISMLKNYRPTCLLVVPPLFMFFIDHPGVRKEYFEHIRMLLCGAAPLGVADEERFLSKIGRQTPIRQGYGLTETTGVLTTSKPGKLPLGSIGSPVPNTELKVVSLEDPGTTLGPNQPGELLVRAPQVMRGYHNNPEATKDTFVDGWMKTGDIAYYDEHESFFVIDRLKELIKVKGFQVPPAELEEIIRDFPDVGEAAVIGVPHQTCGEVPRAYVVPKNGATINLKKLNEYVNEKVATYKRLAGGIEVVDSIPKNPSGKILRRQLRLAHSNK